MARISTYDNDITINDHDRLIGTDGGMINPNDGSIVSGTAGATKNFLLSDVRDYIIGNRGMGVSAGDVPMANADGVFVDSVISQAGDESNRIICIGRFSEADDTVITEASDLKVAGDIRLGGQLQNLNGTPIFSSTGGYQTTTTNGGIDTIRAFTVTVISGPGIKNLPAEPNDGDWIKIVDLTDPTMRVMLNAGTRRFMNDTRTGNNTLILDNSNASFELVYVAKQAAGGSSTDVADHVGWVIVGAQTTN